MNIEARFEQFLVWCRSVADAFWLAGTEPLKHLTIQTGLLFALAILLGWLVALLIRSATWRFLKPVERGLRITTTYHTNTGSIALSLEEYIRAFAKDPEIVLVNLASKTAKINWGNERHKRLQSAYFVVTLVECAPDGRRLMGTPVLTRELRIWRKTNPPREGYLQLDAASLREVREKNNSSLDDADGAEIEGTYDLYVRRVRWYDIRHWLVHPNREIRIALWVTIISTVVPSAIDALFK